MTVHPKFRTCDTCRKRKTRCIELPSTSGAAIDAKCTTCTRLHVPCEYNLGYKKAGRPRSFGLGKRKESSGTGSTSPSRERHRSAEIDRHPSEALSYDYHHHHPNDRRQSESGRSTAQYDHYDRRQSGISVTNRSSPPLWSDNPLTLTHTQSQSHPSMPNLPSAQPSTSTQTAAFSIDDLLEWPTAPGSTSATTSALPANMISIESGHSNPSTSFDLGISPLHPISDRNLEQISDNAVLSNHHQTDTGPSTSSLTMDVAGRLATTHPSLNNAIESVAPWPTIMDILHIFLSYSQTLFPLIHVPTFCKDLATRKDKTDRDLAALILGIVAYAIGQLPLSRFTHQYTRNQLHSLQRRCHSASMSLVDRQYKKISTEQIATLMTAYFYCQSVGKTNQAITVLAEACQLTHLLCLGPQDEGVDCVTRELRRRVFWHVYAVDVTEACSGHPIHLHSFEGFSPLPLDIDDEFLTTRGSFPQSPGATSSLSGFIGVVQLFTYIAECLVRQRKLQQRIRAGKPLSEEEIIVERNWIVSTRLAVDEYMCNLPDKLRMVTEDEPSDPVQIAVLGMQRANVLVTEASLRLTLLDYALEVEPASPVLANEKTMIARTALEVLSALPLDDLASNGESMRGKICRILYHLLRNGDLFDDQTLSSLHGWCNLYSAVHFVQLSKNDLESLFPSRQASPALL